jgi:hypothetical protein
MEDNMSQKQKWVTFTFFGNETHYIAKHFLWTTLHTAYKKNYPTTSHSHGSS